MDEHSLGVLEAYFYFWETVEEIVQEEETRKALLERIDLLVRRIRKKCAKTLPTKLLP